ncbi:MAG: hypothetical protein [Bacteriophage sp.]|nr:MAG: hypothetical protein [Bacteriophage sp.]
MFDYILFWLAQGLAGFIWLLGLVFFLILVFLLILAYAHIKVALCKHENVSERSTDLNVICNKCGKNLGFTGRFDWTKHRGKP